MASALANKRLNIRATAREARLIRTGAETAGESVTEFVLKSACLQAEHILADKNKFVISDRQWLAFNEALDRPARAIPELARLFAEETEAVVSVSE